MKLIELRNVSVAYERFCALENVNLTIDSTDFIGVIGPNGGGKTSLIRAILGLVPHQGEIIYSDTLIKDGRRAIGYLPQLNSFDKAFPISIREVVLSGLQRNKKHLFSRYTKNDRVLADKILKQVDIEEVADKPVGAVSGGQLQRALLCRSVISNPKVLILDEPANFVDNKFERELYEILQDLNSRMAIIMVSHDLGTISSIVKNIVCVNRRVHRHNSNIIEPEQLENYNCPIHVIAPGVKLTYDKR